MPSYLSFEFNRVKVVKIFSASSWLKPIPLSVTAILTNGLSSIVTDEDLTLTTGAWSVFENFNELLIRL